MTHSRQAMQMKCFRDLTDQRIIAILDKKQIIIEAIKKKYIVDENQNKVAVQIDIADFEKIEQILEDYALGQLMKENDASENLDLEQAKKFYDQLDKA